MKDMIKKVREENGGFTLAELLIVVAIIAVLVAIAIPVFTAALHNSKAATDEANARSLYADLQADYLANAASSYTEATWDSSLKDGVTFNGSSSDKFTLSDGEEITMVDSDDTISLSFTEGEGWGVEFKCGDTDKTWGIQ